MKGMKDRYGEAKGKQVFYATANAKNQKPAGENENNNSQTSGASALQREQIDRRGLGKRLMRNLRERPSRG